MREILCKKKNGALIIAMSLLLVFSFVLSPLEVNATVQIDNTNFTVPYARPTTSDTQGYLNVVWVYPDGSKNLDTYFWSITPIYGDSASDMDISASRMDIEIEKDGKIKFTAVVGAGMTGVFSLVCSSSSNAGASYTHVVEYYSFHGSFVYNQINYSNIVDVYSYSAFGNFGYLEDDFPSYSMPLINVIYGTDSKYLEKMDIMNSNIVSIYQMLAEIKNLNVQDANFQTTQITLLNTYLPKIDSCISILRDMNLDLDELYEMSVAIYSALDSIRYEVEFLRPFVADIYYELMDLHQDLLEETSRDEDKSDAFEQSSSNQSNVLNDLNEETNVEKIDIGSTSGTIDENLNLDVDSNYGVLLSTFTNNGTILKMMLAVASMGLISYVLFGKR